MLGHIPAKQRDFLISFGFIITILQKSLIAFLIFYTYLVFLISWAISVKYYIQPTSRLTQLFADQKFVNCVF